MHLYAKPTIENIIIHCGTNDINKDADPEKNNDRYCKPIKIS